MKHFYFFIPLIFLLQSCGTNTHDNSETKVAPQAETTEKQVDVIPSVQERKAVSEALNPDDIYKAPTFFSQETNKIVKLVADSTSYDKQFGESHRVLKIYTEDGGTEKELKSILLPVNSSPDFRYNFADVYAEGKEEWLMIQGYYFFFIYDVVNDHISENIYPPKPKSFEAADAQSASISQLYFEKDKIKGTAYDIGEFAIKMDKIRENLK